MKRTGMSTLLTSFALCASGWAQTEGPALFREGELPELPILAPGGGLVVLELDVTETGYVSSIIDLESPAGFVELVRDQVEFWLFEVAMEEGEPVPSKVMVATLFRAPVLHGGQPPQNVPSKKASPNVPYPLVTVTPNFPPTALWDGAVLVEVEVDAEGNVVAADTLLATPPFEEVSLRAASQWSFRPAASGEATVAYIIFVLRQPVTQRKRH